jgi:hypothetical protein
VALRVSWRCTVPHCASHQRYTCLAAYVQCRQCGQVVLLGLRPLLQVWAR